MFHHRNLKSESEVWNRTRCLGVYGSRTTIALKTATEDISITYLLFRYFSRHVTATRLPGLMNTYFISKQHYCYIVCIDIGRKYLTVCDSLASSHKLPVDNAPCQINLRPVRVCGNESENRLGFHKHDGISIEINSNWTKRLLTLIVLWSIFSFYCQCIFNGCNLISRFRYFQSRNWEVHHPRVWLIKYDFR